MARLDYEIKVDGRRVAAVLGPELAAIVAASYGAARGVTVSWQGRVVFSASKMPDRDRIQIFNAIKARRLELIEERRVEYERQQAARNAKA